MSDQSTKGLVAYCDGGARPNPGPCGSGVHGYIYRPMTEKDKHPTRVNAWVTTASGYMLKKDYELGKAEGVVVLQYFDIVESHGIGTNNVGEIRAVAALLSNDITQEVDWIHIICDSKLVVQGINEWMDGWSKRNWFKGDGQPVSNKEDWVQIHYLVNQYRKKGELVVSWTLGHNNELGNTKADYLATIGVNLSTDQKTRSLFNIYDQGEYYKQHDGVHPFISLKRVYFSTDPEFNSPGVYYQTDGSGKDFVIGKRTSDAVFSVVCMTNEDKILETIIRKETSRATDVNSVVYIKTEALRDQDILTHIERYDSYSFVEDKRNLNLDFLDKKPIVVEVLPGELPLRAFDVLSHLEEVLTEFHTNFMTSGKFFEGSALEYTVVDVTDHFFEQKTKKSGKNEISYYELKKEYGVGVKDTRIPLEVYSDAEKIKVEPMFVFGEDIPPRNSFKHFEGLNPIVYVVTWRDGTKILRYASIIKTDDAVGIWSNYFANAFILKK